MAKKSKEEIKDIDLETISETKQKIKKTEIKQYSATKEGVAELLRNTGEVKETPKDQDIIKKPREYAVLLTIRNGILEEVIDIEAEKKELQKNNWEYRIVSASKKFMVIDYDKDIARPYVKALLAKVNKLREVKMLWAVLIFMLFTYFTFFALFFVQFFKIGDLEKIIAATPKVEKISPIQQQQMNQSPFGNLMNQQQPTPKTQTGVSNRLFPNN